jgi:hypothetical protein
LPFLTHVHTPRSIYLSVCLSVRLSVCPSVRLPTCLPVLPRFRDFTADALHVFAHKVHRAASEISVALNETAQNVQEINNSVESTHLALSLIKYGVGQNSPCFRRVPKQPTPDSERVLVHDELPLFARLQHNHNEGPTRSVNTLETKEENPFGVLYSASKQVGGGVVVVVAVAAVVVVVVVVVVLACRPAGVCVCCVVVCCLFPCLGVWCVVCVSCAPTPPPPLKS